MYDLYDDMFDIFCNSPRGIFRDTRNLRSRVRTWRHSDEMCMSRDNRCSRNRGTRNDCGGDRTDLSRTRGSLRKWRRINRNRLIVSGRSTRMTERNSLTRVRIHELVICLKIPCRIMGCWETRGILRIVQNCWACWVEKAGKVQDYLVRLLDSVDDWCVCFVDILEICWVWSLKLKAADATPLVSLIFRSLIRVESNVVFCCRIRSSAAHLMTQLMEGV